MKLLGDIPQFGMVKSQLVKKMRPVDLAREHELSTQAVRNYEDLGFLPSAERTPSGYRIYTDLHAAALRTYLKQLPAFGYAVGGQIMQAVNHGDLEQALIAVDRGHAQLLRDRETVAAVAEAMHHLATDAPESPGSKASTERFADHRTLSVGEVSRRLGITTNTLRSWESRKILVPSRRPATGHRVYGPRDVRDAELAHLLRRGGHGLAQIATVLEQVRTVGGARALAEAVQEWSRQLNFRGKAMLAAASELEQYTALLQQTDEGGPSTDQEVVGESEVT